jgi:hypothetical protein
VDPSTTRIIHKARSESSTPQGAQGRRRIRPPITPDPRASGVGEGSIGRTRSQARLRRPSARKPPRGNRPTPKRDRLRRVPPPRDSEPVSGQKQSGWGEPRVPGRAREDPDLLDWERPRMARTRRSSPSRRPVRRVEQPPGNRPRRESTRIRMAGLDSGERPGGGRREPRIRSSAWTYSA